MEHSVIVIEMLTMCAKVGEQDYVYTYDGSFASWKANRS